MKLRFFATFALLSIAACSAAPEDATDDVASTQSALSAERIAELKAEIRRISFENIERTDNFAEVRAALSPLVDELGRAFGTRPATENLEKVKGAWRQIFSDFPYPMRGPVSMVPEQIYQVVSADGYYYNLGDSKLFNFIPTTGVLRGAYEPQGNQLAIRFTKVGYRFGFLPKGRDLVSLATDLESGRAYSLSIPGGGEAPQGPVGISGTLRSVYVDDDIRIDIGTQNPFTDENGEVQVPGVGESLFVLDRVTTPVK